LRAEDTCIDLSRFGAYQCVLENDFLSFVLLPAANGSCKPSLKKSQLFNRRGGNNLGADNVARLL
jgi:hypothetical protein